MVISYCATHDTYPEDNEPCWQCANPFIEAQQDRCKKLEETLKIIIDLVENVPELTNDEVVKQADEVLTAVLRLAESVL